MGHIIVLSWDIECNSNSGGFPDPSADEVITIGLVTFGMGKDGLVDGSLKKVALCLNTAECEDKTIELQVYEDEMDMLRAFCYHVVDNDVDVLAGYNTSKFDWAYLKGRWETLAPSGEPFNLSRVSEIHDAPRDLRGAVVPGIVKPVLPGRFETDLFVFINKQYTLDSYSLSYVSKHFLKDDKFDLPPKEIFAKYQNGGKSGRGEIAGYCIQDCDLVRQLLVKLLVIPQTIEMAKVVRTKCDHIGFRGQGIRVYNLAIGACHEHDFLLDDRGFGEDDFDFEGATVMDPVPGLYREPIAVLDFMSLYPSVMQTYNLCPTTLITSCSPKCLDSFTPPGATGTTFVRPSTFRGILPRILEDLLTQRKVAKRCMKDAMDGGDMAMHAIMNAKQLALKVSANSVYGVMGAKAGLIGCVEVASTVTGAGRALIQQTKEIVERDTGCQVIYGDTDSVMLRFPEEIRPHPLGELFSRGETMAASITEHYARETPGSKIVLEMEKIYNPFVLYKKKRYAGLCYEDPAKNPKVDVKGLEYVRRDASPITRQVQEQAMKAMLVEGDLEKASAIAAQGVRSILTMCKPGADFSLLRLSKRRGTDYKKPETMAHLAVCARIEARDPGAGPKSGDRVEFVVLNTGASRVIDKAEDATYSAANQLPLDAVYYIEQFKKPVLRLMETPLKAVPGMYDDLERIFLECEEAARTWGASCQVKDVRGTWKRQPTLSDFFQVQSSGDGSAATTARTKRIKTGKPASTSTLAGFTSVAPS